tara:strand:- start:291 stop:2615 length:2325 start_codon:yes stop_codon:yes gene_type:complete
MDNFIRSKMNIIDFLNKNSILWMPINLKVKNGKKELLKYTEEDIRPSYTDFTKNITQVIKRQSYEGYDYIWIDTNFVQQLDVDDEKTIFDYDRFNFPRFDSVGKKLPHFFIKIMQDENLGFTFEKCKYSIDDGKVELLSGQGSYARRDAIVNNPDQRLEIPVDGFYELIPDLYKSQNDETILDGDTIPLPLNQLELLSNEEMKTLLLMLNPKYSSKYHEWFRVACALKNLGYSFELFDRFSKKSENKYGNTFKIWNSIHINSESNRKFCGMGTLMKFLKDSNIEHFEIVKDKLKNKRIEANSVVSGITSITCASNKIDHFDNVVKMLAEYCREHGYAFQDNNIYKRQKPMYYTRMKFNSKKHERNINIFLKNVVFRECSNFSVKWVLSRPNKVNDLIKVTDTEALGFKQFHYDRYIIGFKNGYLDVLTWSFHNYDENSVNNLFSKTYFDVDFDLSWLTIDWDKIICPIFDSLWNCQVNDPEAIFVAYALLGQLHFPINDNNFQVAPYIKGTPNCGKSTLTEAIVSFFPSEEIGNFDYKQKIFGLANLVDKQVVIDTDSPPDMVECVGKTQFQKLISGENNTIPIKNCNSWEGILDMHVLMCSNYMQDVKECGEIHRRLAVFLFGPIEGKNPNYKSQILKETHLIFIKTIRAYQLLKIKYSDKAFEEWGIDYFDNQKEEALYNNNPVYKFIEEDNGFKIKQGSYTKWTEFESAFKAVHRNYKLKTTDLSFTRMGLKITRINICIMCKNSFIKGCCENYSKDNMGKIRIIMNLETK